MLRRTALPCLMSGLLIAGLVEPASAAPTWLAEKTLSAAGHDVQDPHLVVNSAGVAIAVWRRLDDAGHWRIQSARHPVGGTWSATSTLSAAGQSAMNPDVAIDGAGTATVVWERSDGTYTRIQERHSTAAGSWSATVNLSAATAPAVGAQVVVDGHGTTTVAWGRADAGVRRIESRRHPSGGTWSQPSWLSAAGANNFDPELAVNSAGTVVAVWSRVDKAVGHWRAQAVRRTATGAWSTPVYLSGAADSVTAPVVAIDAHGAATAVWRDTAGVYDVIMASRQAAGGSWSAPQSLSLPSLDTRDQRLAVNAHGDAVVVWRRSDGTTNRIETARRPASGSWTAPETLTPFGLNADEADVAIGSAGDVIATWYLEDISIHVQTRRLPAGGTWAAAAYVGPMTGTTDQPRVAFDGQGNVVAVWRWRESTDWRTQATAFDSAGPVAHITKPATLSQKSKTFTVAWSAVDRWSGVAHTDVRYRSAPSSGTFGSWTTWKTNSTATSASFTGSPGRTYCFEVSGTDTLDNVGAWSAERCVAIPLDDRSLSASSSWERKTGSSYYLSTATVGSKHGAALTRADVHAKRIVVLATRCPSCGKVTILLGGTSLGTFNLAASTTTNKALVAITTFSAVRTGTLTIRIASTGKVVRIDGVVVSRI